MNFPRTTTASPLDAAKAANETDARWVGVRRLDEEAGPRLQRHLAVLLGSVDDVDDLVQESLLTAWRAWDRFDGPSSRLTWLLGIATFVVRNQRTKHQRRASLIDRWLGVSAAATTHSGKAEMGSQLRELYASLEDVNPHDREAFLLVYVEGHSAREAAEILSIPSSTVHLRASRTADCLRAQLKEDR
jgi:RNA polymerase sigma-70 factor (ECF subfamily)